MVAQARKLTAVGRDRGRPLADFLAERLSIERQAAVALVRSGAVYVGRGRVEAPERPLEAGVRVTVYVPPAGAAVEAGAAAGAAGRAMEAGAAGAAGAAGGAVEAGAAAGAAGRAMEVGGPAGTGWLAIVFEDRDVIVVDKPVGVPSQATRATSVGALDRIVAAADPGARLLHRLDRDASGLVMFTRTARARRRFARLLADGRVERRYAAVAWGHVPAPGGTFDRPIGPHPADRRRMAAGHGRDARTHYRVLRHGRSPAGTPTTLLEIDLATGRTHQIRVHLADAGHPLCGDRLYGPDHPPGPVDRLCLHACRLAWPGGKPVISPMPALFEFLVSAE